MWFVYIILIILILFILFYGYVRCVFKFWSIQPVFHVYNIFYWLFPPGIIDHSLPSKNKYTNLFNIKSYDLITNDIKHDFVDLINNHYFRFNNVHYNPKMENIIPYFNGHNLPCFYSFYYDDLYTNNININNITDISCNSIKKTPKMIGSITGRPLYVELMNKKITAYYIDFLCVDENRRGQGIAPELIQTYEYNQRHNNKDIDVCIFKKDTDLTGIVPITIYMNYMFNILRWKKPKKIHSSFSVLKINENNIHFVYDYIYNYKFLFKLRMYPHLSNIIELLKTNNLHIYTISQNKNIIGIYFFRNATTIYNNFQILEFFASIYCYKNTKFNNKFKDTFIYGFHKSMFQCFKQHNYKYIIIENISHNNIIIDEIIKTHTPMFVSPSAFYFYNFGMTPYFSNDVFALY